MTKVNLEGMRKTAEQGREECRQLFEAANAVKATEAYRYSETLQAAVKELWAKAKEIEALGECLGIFNEIEGWFC